MFFFNVWSYRCAPANCVQTWNKNMSICGEPVIEPCGPGVADSTKVTFSPDLKRKQQPVLPNICQWWSRLALDLFVLLYRA